MLPDKENLVSRIDLKMTVRLIKDNTVVTINIKITAVLIILFALLSALFQALCRL